MRITFQDKTWDFDTYDEDDFIKEMMDLSDGDVNLDHLQHLSVNGLDSYFKFLNFEDFEMDEEIEKTFDFLGYPNINKYPLDYWKCKLHDNRVREKGEYPLSSLVDVTDMVDEESLQSLIRKQKSIPDRSYIAGGSIVDLIIGDTKYVTQSRDIDVFLLEGVKLEEYIMDVLPHVSMLKTKYTITFNQMSPFLQFIMKTHKTPAEIVHNFDIDASGLIFVDGRIYATHCAEYALENDVNFVDLDRYTSSYVWRLVKYKVNKGFRIRIPQFNPHFHNLDDLQMISNIDKVEVLHCLPKYILLLLAVYNCELPDIDFENPRLGYECEEDEIIDKTNFNPDILEFHPDDIFEFKPISNEEFAVGFKKRRNIIGDGYTIIVRDNIITAVIGELHFILCDVVIPIIKPVMSRAKEDAIDILNGIPDIQDIYDRLRKAVDDMDTLY